MASGLATLYPTYDSLSAAGEAGGALFDEGAAAFQRIFAGADVGLDFDLTAELVGVGGLLAGFDEAARGDQGARGTIGQAAGEIKRARHELGVVEDFAHQAP